MNPYSTTQLAEIRRHELIAEGTYHRQARRHRSDARRRARTHPNRPLSAFHAWLAAGQL